MAIVLTARERRWLALFIIGVVGVRLATLGTYPLMDTTEARYAEIARKMLETGAWLMPQFDYGVPFWGKPPLSIWLSAASMAVFGVNEFAARLPSLLMLMGGGALVYAVAALRGGRDQALWTLALFVATGLVFVIAGGVMTDPALALGTTLSMAGFWIALNGPERSRRLAGYAFFAGLAIGLLAKGPVALVLVFVPVGAAALWSRSWRAAWQRVPWIVGSATVAVVTVAWYWAAERASPGFLGYFLAGEHWKRFVEPGWKGDLYGSAHPLPHGMIWPLWILAALPWSISTLTWLVHLATRRRDQARVLIADPWCKYFVLWALTPMLFFTTSGNILVTYVLPGLPAFVLLLGDFWRPERVAGEDRSAAGEMRPVVRRALIAGAAIPAMFIAAMVLFHGKLETEYSQKALVRDLPQIRAAPESRLIYFPQRPYSAEFYSRGLALKATDMEALHRNLEDSRADFFVIREEDLAALPEADRSKLVLTGTYGVYRLLREAQR